MIESAARDELPVVVPFVCTPAPSRLRAKPFGIHQRHRIRLERRPPRAPAPSAYTRHAPRDIRMPVCHTRDFSDRAPRPHDPSAGRRAHSAQRQHLLVAHTVAASVRMPPSWARRAPRGPASSTFARRQPASSGALAPDALATGDSRAATHSAPQTHGGDHLPTASISRGRYSVNPRRAALPGVYRTRLRTTNVPPPPPIPLDDPAPHVLASQQHLSRGPRPAPASIELAPPPPMRPDFHHENPTPSHLPLCSP
ncbi:hypothetical protein B0H16DRAFT_714961 [Mycena metata]|uniref:Uncharacterized protein n=1 Tax=Mycena metata TaxID=1033252 RepID=A0AAD7M754_9AGAR|nr:hypothetical protein B0H16DRAFT_714961 [Mycena metata]